MISNCDIIVGEQFPSNMDRDGSAMANALLFQKNLANPELSAEIIELLALIADLPEETLSVR